jgi:hypothetical protein
MPRIYDSASNPLDFCRRDFPSAAAAAELYGDPAITGLGPDGRGNCFGYNEDHPGYADTDYTCQTCGEPLTEADD